MNDSKRTLDCESAIQLLQDWMDGSSSLHDSEVQRHFNDCTICWERFQAAQLLLSAFPPKLSSNFADRLTVQIRADRRQRQWKQYCIAAGSLAATLLFGIWMLWPMTMRQNRAVDVAKSAPTPSLDRQMARAATAMRDWTGRTAAAIPRPELPSTNMLPGSDVTMALQPMTSPLAEAGKGLADGFEPLALSAKRAANRFWKDLPVTE